MRGSPRQPPPFEYHRPATLAEALELIGRDEAAALAGGTDVIPLRNAGAIGPRHLVDVKHLEELRGIASAGDELWIGAATTCAELTRALDAPAVGALGDGAAIVGAVQTRARATVGGEQLGEVGVTGSAQRHRRRLPGLIDQLVGREGAKLVAAEQPDRRRCRTGRRPQRLARSDHGDRHRLA